MLLFAQVQNSLSTFATDAASELDVLWHDGYTLGVDCAKVGILEKTYEVVLPHQ